MEKNKSQRTVPGINPSDVDLNRIPFFHKAETDALANLVGEIFRHNGNRWSMTLDAFRDKINNATLEAGGIAQFIGAGSIERIQELECLEFDNETVRFTDKFIDYQIKHNLRFMPSIRNAIGKRLGF